MLYVVGTKQQIIDYVYQDRILGNTIDFIIMTDRQFPLTSLENVKHLYVIRVDETRNTYEYYGNFAEKDIQTENNPVLNETNVVYLDTMEGEKYVVGTRDQIRDFVVSEGYGGSYISLDNIFDVYPIEQYPTLLFIIRINEEVHTFELYDVIEEGLLDTTQNPVLDEENVFYLNRMQEGGRRKRKMMKKTRKHRKTKKMMKSKKSKKSKKSRRVRK